MKTGLKVRNWTGIKRVFLPFCTVLDSYFLIGNVGFPTGLRRGWDIPVRFGSRKVIPAFRPFLPVCEGLGLIIGGVETVWDGNNGGYS